MNTQPRWSPVEKQVVDASGDDRHPKSQAMRSAWQSAQCNSANKAAAVSGRIGQSSSSLVTLEIADPTMAGLNSFFLPSAKWKGSPGITSSGRVKP